MNISVVVVCYNEEKNIVPCLQSLVEQKYPSNQYEILVIDNNSSDHTQHLIENFIQKNPLYFIRLLVNPDRGISISRNIGWQKAKFDLVAYLDADCRAPSNWLMTMSEGFQRYCAEDDRLAGVGGGNIPDSNGGRFLEGLGVLLDTFWGNHNSVQGKRFKNDTLVPHIPTLNVLYKKEILKQNGGFDETYGNICEDTELNHRLVKAGYHLIFLKDSIVFHKMRPSLHKWFFNMITYGKGRIWVIRKHPSHFHWMYLIPFIFVISMGFPFFFWISPWFLLPLIYFPVLGLITGYELWRRKKEWRLFPILFFSYAITHFGFGFGEWYGLFRGRGKR